MVPSSTPARSDARRDRAILVGAIALLTVFAWIYLLHLGSAMPADRGDMSGMTSMPGMDMGRDMAMAAAPAFRPWGFAGFALVFLMWAVMMVGMMLPSVAPMALLYAGARRGSGGGPRPLASTGWFVSGYLSAWLVFSLIATAGQWMLTRLALLNPMMASASPWLGGGLLIAAGIYQWSPYKRSCLAHCHTPMTFVMQHGGFSTGAAGALRDGAHHGGYCLGCCALLMTLLFVGGVMNILWIAGLSVLVLVEKIWSTDVVPRAAGAMLIVAGLILLAR